MHLKNFSLITRNKKVQLSPVYDLLNSTIAIGKAKEELALPLNGKKQQLKKNDFLDYFAVQRLGLNERIISNTLIDIQQAIPEWKKLIKQSFLSPSMQHAYLMLLDERIKRLDL